jgi:hypothetical protein
MPSPFPGMDPYLEGAEWTSVHAALGAEIARQLAPKVSPNYIVRPVRRFVVDLPDEMYIPTVMAEKVPVLSIEIRNVVERELITALEILSPVNKRGQRYTEYLEIRYLPLRPFYRLHPAARPTPHRRRGRLGRRAPGGRRPA